MQSIRKLERVLARLADGEHYLFSSADLQGALPGQRDMAVLLSRTSKAGLLKRVCRGIYLYDRADYARGLVLFHVAALLRAAEFNYLSLETVLIDSGAISQVPISWITLMSSGRSSVIKCGTFGRIEFVHTARKPDDVAGLLSYDPACRLWRATPALAMRDMRATRRNKDLIDQEVVNEPV